MEPQKSLKKVEKKSCTSRILLIFRMLKETQIFDKSEGNLLATESREDVAFMER